jgi:hypothetical protein
VRIEKVDNSRERKILTGMIVSSKVLAKIAPKWTKDGLFRSNWSNTVGDWCVKYFQKYNKAPRKQIEGLFESWSQNRKGDETVRLVEKFLTGLSEDYDRKKGGINVEYLIDEADSYFNEVGLTKLAQAIQGDLDAGKPDDALKRVSKFSEVRVSLAKAIDLLKEESEMTETMKTDKKDVLFQYPGALKAFFGDSLERDGFLAFMGKEKAGKSFALLDLAWRAMLHRCRVAFFEVGDLSKRQLLRRFYTRAMNRPLRPTLEGKPVRIPTKLDPDAEKGGRIALETKEYKDSVSWEQIRDRCKKIMVDRIGSTDSFLRVSVHPNSSISVAGVRGIVREWEVSGWVPDVVVIDYADILSNPVGFNGESRDAINENWKAMRRMSQELHCLVVTATQANAASYQADILGMQNFSEDKRKFSHVTGMIGINQDNDDKMEGIQRWNWLVLREGEFNSSKEVYVAGSPAVANPAVLSSF